MRQIFVIFAMSLYATTTRAGQLIATYNLISSPFVVPQTYSTLSHNLVAPSPRLLTPGVVPAATPGQDLAHPAVVENAIAESHLPQELLNPFYKNPQIASALAKESWFTNKEFPVHNREAEKIPRERILSLIQRLQHRRR